MPPVPEPLTPRPHLARRPLLHLLRPGSGSDASRLVEDEAATRNYHGTEPSRKHKKPTEARRAPVDLPSPLFLKREDAATATLPRGLAFPVPSPPASHTALSRARPPPDSPCSPRRRRLRAFPLLRYLHPVGSRRAAAAAAAARRTRRFPTPREFVAAPTPHLGDRRYVASSCMWNRLSSVFIYRPGCNGNPCPLLTRCFSGGLG